MPKQRKKRKPVAAAPTPPSKQNQNFPRWIRYSAITLILMLILSVLVGAIASVPAKAATFTPLPSCAPIDTDMDGITNNTDSDIDGDGIVNGKDPDIDGDGISNAQDADPAATNCDTSTKPPVNVKDQTEQSGEDSPWRIPVIVLIGAAGVGYIVLRQRRSQKIKSGKVD